MRRRRLLILLLAIAVSGLGVGVFLGVSCRRTGPAQTDSKAAGFPRIQPDYAGITLPPNIAPLNFVVREPGRRYYVKIRSLQGREIEIAGGKPQIRIPMKPWKDLLRANRGNPLFVDVCVQDEGREWRRYEPIVNRIAEEDIDPYVMYRLMKPIYNWWRNIGVYQRNLENFDESLVLHGRSFANGCVNCHSFADGNPDKMLLGIRSAVYGSAALLWDGGKVSKIGTTFGHTAWRPNGRLAVFTGYRVRQFFHAKRAEIRDVVELDSRMSYYDLEKKSVGVAPPLSDKDQLETHPNWSPDGRYLYFSSAPVLWTDRQTVPPERYDELKYDLKRVSYDPQTGQWGEVETVLSSEETGLSILLPRISPDGRFLLFCMCDYSCFTLNQPSSDLYLMDLATRKYRKLERANSDQAEAWHCWSANGRWIVFSSKRTSVLFTKLYFAHIDENGNESKPFVLPQRNPLFYDSYLNLYNVPELITGRLMASPRALLRAVRSPEKIEVDSVTGATPDTPAPAPAPNLRRD
ncbi:MAG TPA: hypothetical protein VM492_09320 [Sumerlaeia bacterium]|nr:hypothetical protein [Sumerlaeia bacterium]